MATDRQNLFWTLAHIGLGFVCTLTPFVLIVWFYLLLFTNLFKANNLLKNKKPAFFLMLFSYLVSFEVLDRMAKTSPYIPYELGKYLLILVGVLGLIQAGVRSQQGIRMVLLITPALFYDYSGQRVFFDIINNYFAPLAVGLGVAFADRLSITKSQLNQILKFTWLGCLASLVYPFIKTPDLENITFTLKAQFETTGGHASNQVATVLGLGLFLTFYSLFNKLRFSGNSILDIVILAGFTFQGLLSFSRGGMVVGALGIFMLLILPESRKKGSALIAKNKSILVGVVMLFAIYCIFELTNSLTGGNLLLRYQGETAGTMLGTKEVTADHFVSGRLGIFEKDLNLWLNHFFTGVGCGVSPYLRDLGKHPIAAHVELSRLLAEHGILGFFFSLIFFVGIPLKCWRSNADNPHRIILITLMAIAILTTFHAAMRTFVTPLFMIIGCLKISESKIFPNKLKSN
jgi:hypothetical protein